MSERDFLFIDELADVLGLSRRSIERARKYGTFLIPELDALDRRPRWSRKVVQRFLDGEGSGRQLLRKVS